MVEKSSRHSKITGDFGENLVNYWLSRRGFESAVIDHTGIDIISRRPNDEEILGISVKTRSRSEKNEYEPLNIKKEDVEKANEACKSFKCTPYFAIVADMNTTIRVFLFTSKHLCKLYKNSPNIIAFSLSKKKIEEYKEDKEIEYFELRKEGIEW